MGFTKLFMAHTDLAIEFLIAAGVGILAAKAVPSLVDNYYDKVAAEHVEDVGLKASESTAWANSISDILSNDTFSIVVKDRDEYKFDGSAYWRDEDPSEIYNVELMSGERVAVRIQNEYLKENEDGTYLLNIGRVQDYDLTAEPDILEELQEDYDLDRTDFYVDLRSDVTEGRKYSEGTREKTTDLIQPFTGILVTAVLWVLLHVLTVKLGIAPKLFGRRKSDDE